MAMYRPKGMSKLIERTQDTPDLVIKETGVLYAGQFYHYDPNAKAYFTGRPSDPEEIKEELVDAPPVLDGGFEDKPFVPKNEYDRLAKDNLGYSIRVTDGLPSFEGGPSDLDRKLGFYVRYFAQRKSDGVVFELDRSTYRLLKQKSNKYHYPSYFIGSTTWILQGPVADEKINGYIVYGAGKKNENFINNLQQQIPNIRTYLADPSEFVK